MTNNKIQAYALRIERLLEERDGINSDIKDIYTEVTKAGFDAPGLRAVIAERRKKTDPFREAAMENYHIALGMPGATYRSVAEQTGISKSKLQRLVPREESGTPSGEADEVDSSVGGGGVLAPAAAPPANPAAVVMKATTRAAALLGLETPIEDLTHWTDGLAIPEHPRRKA